MQEHALGGEVVRNRYAFNAMRLYDYFLLLQEKATFGRRRDGLLMDFDREPFPAVPAPGS